MPELTVYPGGEQPEDATASERLVTWMDRYIVAWTENHPDHIAALFTEDAVYDPQTADGELHGVEEIVSWWREIGDDPDNWSFEWLPLVEEGDLAIITGSTRYADPPSSYRNLWVIRFDESGRCRDFTEWYVEEDDG
jgi:ketosteroid isomerase-like protein